MEEFINAVFSYQYYWEALAALALWLYLLKRLTRERVQHG